MNEKSLEEQFAAYEMDFSQFEKKPQLVDDLDMDFSQYEQEPQQAKTLEEQFAPADVAALTDSTNEAPDEEDVQPVTYDVDNDEGEEEEEEEEENVTPLTSSDLETLISQQEEAIELCDKLRNQAKQLSAMCDDDNMPRGLRTVIRNLVNTDSVFVATKLLYETYVQIDVEPLLQTIEKSKLKKWGIIAVRTLKAHEESLTANLKKLENLIDDGEDRAALVLQTRLIKQQTSAIMDNAQKQAEAFSKTLDDFPLENGQLVMLQTFNEGGTRFQKECVDRTLKLSETAMALTADAKEMLQAVQQNNLRVIADLQKKMIEATYTYNV